MAEKDCRTQLEPQAVALYGLIKPDGRSYTDAEIGEQLGVSATSIRNWRNSNKDAWEQARSAGGGLLLRLRQLLDGAVAELERLGAAGVLEKYNLDGLIKINSLANGAEERRQRAMERLLELRRQNEKPAEVDRGRMFQEVVEWMLGWLKAHDYEAFRQLEKVIGSLIEAYKEELRNAAATAKTH